MKERKKWVTFTYLGNYNCAIRKLFKHLNIKITFKTTNTIGNVLPFSVGETSDGGQCWAKHGKVYILYFHVKLATLGGLAVHLRKGRVIILMFMFYILYTMMSVIIETP
jgi:hypothetical protein